MSIELGSGGAMLFGRAYSVVVAPTGSAGALGAIESTLGFDVSNLRCTFKVKKTLKPTPNTCEIKVWNLAGASRRVLEDANKLAVRLEAGYEKTGTSQLYFGETRAATTEWDPDGSCISTMTSGDSEKEIAEARIHVSIGPGVPPNVAMMSVARALGVSEGNLTKAAALMATKGLPTTMYGPGTVISGNAARELTDICRSAGLEWSIQDGKLQILNLGAALSDQAVELSSDTGLVGSPQIDFNASSKKKQGGIFVKAKCLIIPELACGRKVSFDSREVKGGFRIEQIEYTGDTHGDDWYAEIVARSY